ncbi:putative holin-like toxin [Ligilactobacillus agilis]
MFAFSTLILALLTYLDNHNK